MMKKLSILVLILFVSFVPNSFAISPAILQMVVSGETCSSSGLLFSWHCENTDVTLGIPCGCSMGDTTATSSGSPTLDSGLKYNGTYSVDSPDGNDAYYFDITNEDIFHFAEGKLEFRAYIETAVDDGGFILVDGDTNDYIRVRMQTDSGNDIQVVWACDGTTDWID